MYHKQPQGLEIPDALSHRGVETSIAAGIKASHSSADVKRQIIQALRYQVPEGATSDELSALLRIAYENLQPRVSDLKREGFVVKAGERYNHKGNKTNVWKLK